jgi:hypothetical protein
VRPSLLELTVHIVPSWSQNVEDYKNVILVIDRDCGDWVEVTEKGALLVKFDLEHRWQVEVPEEYEDSPLLDPNVICVIVGEQEMQKMQEEQLARYRMGDYVDRGEFNLFFRMERHD